MKNYFIFFTVFLCVILVGCEDSIDEPEITEPEINEPGIVDIKSFLNTCPESDPFLTEILEDFEIRLNGEVVSEFKCESPVSSMSVSDFQKPLIVLQSLRVIRHMETGILPWTNESLYDWMKNNIDGIDIQDGISGGNCCTFYDDTGYKLFIVIGNSDEFNRSFKKKWIGISSTIDLIAHEVRHVLGPGDTSCCGIDGGCDQVYDLNNISSYGIQLWLNRRWLDNRINVGLSSHTSQELDELKNWFRNSVEGFEARFCE